MAKLDESFERFAVVAFTIHLVVVVVVLAVVVVAVVVLVLVVLKNVTRCDNIWYRQVPTLDNLVPTGTDIGRVPTISDEKKLKAKS